MSTTQTNSKGFNIPKTKLGQSKMEKLLIASEELFATRGFYNTSISDICKKAKTAVGTFYIYFETKTDVYRYLMEKYKQTIRTNLAESIKNCNSRYEKEREGIKCYIKFAVSNPNVYNVIWGSLSIDKQLFIDYYESFAASYSHSLENDSRDVSATDTDSIAYFLMGVSNFVGLRAIFTKMSDDDIDRMIDETIMPALKNGIFKQNS